MNNEKRGTKRKHSEVTMQDLGTRVKGKLHHSVKEVKKAAKKAKTFEIQKAIKRLKDTRKKNPDSDDVVNVEGELQRLKDMDHEYIALVALRSKLKKTKLLHDHPVIQEATSQELDLPSTKASSDALDGKLQSRLLSSKILAGEVHSVIEDLKSLISPKPHTEAGSPEDEETGSSKKAKRSKAEPSNALSAEPSSLTGDGSEEEQQEQWGEEEEDDEGEERMQPDFAEDEVDGAGWESGTVEENEEAEDDGWESGSISDKEHAPAASSDDEDEDNAAPPQNRSKPTKPTASATKATAKSSGASSTFLPSLSVGYIQGSDDSDFSDSEAKIADPEIKKNRRGQRARRAIWEKKYGRNANHKKKEAAENQKAMRSAALNATGRSRPARFGAKSTQTFDPKIQNTDRGWAGMGARNSTTPAPAPSQKRSGEGKALHPSWEAKKKLKEKEGIIPSQGKKIVF